MHPRIVVNAKAYREVEGEGALRLARACQVVAEETGDAIALAPPMVELAALGRRDDLPDVVLLAQHVDARAAGAATGWTTATALHAAGAKGSLVNHAEHKLADVGAHIATLHEAGLWSLACADGMEETRALSRLAPTLLAIEPPELIGGDVSVTTADPAVVRDAAAAVRDASATLPLCGAGVKTGRDVAAAIELGAYGVLLASGVVKAADPVAALRDLASGLP